MPSGQKILKNLAHPYNTRIKYYPLKDGTLRPYQIIVSRSSMFSEKEACKSPGFCVEREKAKAFSTAAEAVAESAAETPGVSPELPITDWQAQTAIRNYKAAHRRLYDKIQSNPQLNLFVTLTLDEKVINRFNYNEIVKHLSTWLDNRVRRDGLQYILVPEHHDVEKAMERYIEKNGSIDGFHINEHVAIHWHGLMNDNGLHLENSHHKDHGKTIYNITDYPYGFTTAKRVTNPKNGNYSDAISKYVHKYMTKALKNVENNPEALNALKIGGRYYLSGGNLNTPEYFYTNFDYNAVDGKSLTVDGYGTQIKVLTAEDLTFSRLLNQIIGGNVES